jgi:hypothetical protein
MLNVPPRADEAGFLGFAIADALLDLLVEKACSPRPTPT